MVEMINIRVDIINIRIKVKRNNVCIDTLVFCLYMKFNWQDNNHLIISC